MAVDPLLGLKFDPAKTVFEIAPPDTFRRCPDLVNPHTDRRLFLFAKARVDGADYEVLGGFYVRRRAGANVLLTDPAGAIAVLRAQGCKLVGPAREEFDTPNVDVARATLFALAKDATQRYRRAFGGSARLGRIIRAQAITLDAKHSEILAATFGANP